MTTQSYTGPVIGGSLHGKSYRCGCDLLRVPMLQPVPISYSGDHDGAVFGKVEDEEYRYITIKGDKGFWLVSSITFDRRYDRTTGFLSIRMLRGGYSVECHIHDRELQQSRNGTTSMIFHEINVLYEKLQRAEAQNGDPASQSVA